MFHQIEGLVISENVNFGHLKNEIMTFIDFFFGIDTKVALVLIRDEMNVIGFAKVLQDKQRIFTRDQVRIAFDEQGGICAICNEEMPEFNEDVHGDHILLYKDGHPTTQENCAAVHSTCNWRK